MHYSAFTDLLSAASSPVVLLEGTRELPNSEARHLTRLAAHLEHTFPQARFRTGNAEGSDTAFAAGVARVDSSRLELIVPYPTHRSKQRPVNSSATAIDNLPAARVQELINATLQVSPQYQRVAVNYRKHKTHPRQRATAQLILRDTLKVTGADAMQSPIAGIFYVHAADPNRGGTGHTMRVCRAQGIPIVTQFEWLKWSF